jgi:anti-anti-sigma factor
VTIQHTYRLGHIDPDKRRLRDGAMVTVGDDDGATVLAVRRWTDPGPPGAEPARPLTVVAADGDIDLDTAPLLRHALVQALDCRAPVCCDLSGVTFFGATAAGLLLDTHRRATESGQVFFLRGARAMTEYVLAVVDPDRVVARF